MEPSYQNREIDEKFKDIKEQLNRIESQTTKTNGKVAGLQSRSLRLEGGILVLTVILLPILGWALLVLVNLK